MRTLLVLLALWAVACGGSSAPKKTPAAPDSAVPRGPALEAKRIAVIGASLSAGVGAKPLATLLRRTLPKGVVVIDCANAMTFQRPYRHTRDQLACATKGRAEAILALDTLFWFAYHNRSLEAKRGYLDAGIALLHAVKVPLFVGDLPDMRSAGGVLIPRSHIPSPAVLGTLNGRIHAFAAERPHVHVLPFSAWSKPLLSKGRIVPAPGLAPIPAADALHVDGLHPNGKGTLYLLSNTLRAIRRAYPGTPRDRFRLTPALEKYLMTL